MQEFIGYGDDYKITKRSYHGESKTPLYKRWQQIKRRIFLPSTKFFKDYGGRGIKIDSRWLKFENFLLDMGKPITNDLEIDRINNNGPYCKSNCRWVPRKVNARNKRRYGRTNKFMVGVRLNNNMFVARININGKTKYLGSFKTEQEAHARFIQERNKRQASQGICISEETTEETQIHSL